MLPVSDECAQVRLYVLRSGGFLIPPATIKKPADGSTILLLQYYIYRSSDSLTVIFFKATYLVPTYPTQYDE